MKPVAIIGMGLSPEDLTARHLRIIESADILVGGQRLLDYFKETAAQKQPIDKNIAKAVEFIKDRMSTQSIVVLASGDPLFFGIGSILIKTLGPKHVDIYPNISSIAAAFARIKEPWSQVQVVSLHGRKNDRAIFKALNEGKTVAVFTDPTNNPARIAKGLITEEFANIKMCVLEALGTKLERFDWYHLDRASEMTFSEPNLLILKRINGEPELKQTPHLGIPDHQFEHEKGLITKSEIRAISLAKLQLLPGQVLWDLGAGSGSVSIEAALLVGEGKVIAVERNRKRINQIKTNINRFEITNVDVVQAVLPEGLAGLTQPDRIFIGGGGKTLQEIIKVAVLFLKADGIVVINTVLMPNVLTAMETLEALGLKTSMVQAQISHSRKMPWAERLEAQNPVWIISGIRKSECGSGK
ncbi:Cobalt-precorrin-7 (C5)-methyltransferase (EC / Cobalt-precorrin-6B C15-methyltransferase [decarboxylating] (EC [Olavius sp. associated proteobacterium Delta 1]|nr:Cobalt-precorrin-7 (C5)-methyltransferase (EC / Cobalt-precorrin-6B C15-methyltransferase [decarboxylating] (EC [Olavius sp. associated proteobacterium Delta 1]